MNRYEQIYNIFWICLSILVCILSLRMKLWSAAGPEGGFLPFCVGLLMGVSGLSLFIMEWRRKHDSLPQGVDEDHNVDKKDWKKIVYILIGFCAMAYLMPILGFILTSTIVLGFLFLLTHRQRWKISVTLAVIFSVSFYFFFNLFEIQLPKGIFGF